MEGLLKCRKCNWVKPESAFYPYQPGECRECTTKRVRANRAEKRDYYNAYDRARSGRPDRVEARKQYANNPEKVSVFNRAKLEWAARNRAKVAASVAINNAKKRGRIKPLPCLICGHEKTEAHHASYDLPLDVVWLCDTHHKQVHKEFRELMRDMQKKESA